MRKLSEIAPGRAPRGPRCFVCAALDRLTSEERADMEDMLADRDGWTAPQIAAVFGELGGWIGPHIVARHRRGECRELRIAQSAGG